MILRHTVKCVLCLSVRCFGPNISTKQSPRAAEHSLSHIPHLLCNPQAHYPALFRIWSQLNPVLVFPTYAVNIHLLLSSHLRVGFPSGLYPPGFATLTPCVSVLPHTCRMPCPPNSSWLHNPSNIGWAVQTVQLSWCPLHQFSHPLNSTCQLRCDLLLSFSLYLFML